MRFESDSAGMANANKTRAKPLRDGFTTGSACAAAAFAAVTRLLGGQTLSVANITLPPFHLHDGMIIPDDPRDLAIPVESVFSGDARAQAWVKKDAGDDPDATNGLRFGVQAALYPLCPLTVRAPNKAKPSSDVWIALPRGVFVKAMDGIGMVTLPGLPVPVGEPAINPQPRLQIAFAARQAALACGHEKTPLYLHITVPEGEEKALHTLNPRLGICGGISILGTRGTVKAYSHDAWEATITQGLHVLRAMKEETAVFSTGRGSEKALQALLPHLPDFCFIQAADFAAHSIREATRAQCRSIVWGCYAGKLLKLAQGLEYTHAKSGRSDLPLLATLADQAGASTYLHDAIHAMPTAQGAFDLLEAHNPNMAYHTATLLAQKALLTLTHWSRKECGSCPPAITLILLKRDSSIWLQLGPPARCR